MKDMVYNSLHNRWLRLLAAVAGEAVVALALNLFIVPLNLYSGGLMGVCQLIRSLLQDRLGLHFGGVDIAGVLYFISNVPILLLAYKTLGRGMTLKTIICTVSFSFFYSIIPIPSTPIVDDYLTACMLGGIIVGVASGIVLTCGGSGGGLDIVGLCLSKRGSRFTVGKFSLTFNFFLYAACLILFVPEVAIYSVIYNFFTSMVLDRMHQQNVSVQAMIFTKEDEKALGRFIIEKMGRSVTYWEGTGAYSGKGLHVLVVCLSKFEIEELLHAVHERDPHAFTTVQERVRVYGNFRRKLE
ncbi:YitT family protein [Oscillospiraceae bacterium 38-13]